MASETKPLDSFLSRGRNNEISLELRTAIVEAVNSGRKQSDAARDFNVSRQSVSRLIQRLKESGSVARSKRSGRPRKIVTARQTRAALRKARRELRASAQASGQQKTSSDSLAAPTATEAEQLGDANGLRTGVDGVENSATESTDGQARGAVSVNGEPMSQALEDLRSEIRSEMRSIRAGMQEMVSNINTVNDKVDALNRKLAISDRNSIARLQNSIISHDGVYLVPLYSPITGEVAHNYPSTLKHLDTFTASQVDALLTQLGEPGGGQPPTRKRQLYMALGITARVV
ncbi:hypothetical protein CDD81_1553 [Ophiocordyceps australis]|uniref:Insertion element IS150 protein InsJ-like helix-turn-helix domain-containing protein n=1 Tax=Ophiocordyceps australis TaxID=1399860 RepID=A0A2C5XFC3_9HYPO|nr:hypothetical protein CDD81_1553 [Ophiocordyceps australis]